MNTVIATGKNVKEATENALKELGLSPSETDKVQVNVLQQGGFLKKAKVEVTLETGIERAKQFLENTLQKMGFAFTVDVTESAEKITFTLTGEKSAAVIGYRGEVIDALQFLTSLVANKGEENFKRIVVDCENYRQKRDEVLKRLAEKLAAKAVRTGKRVELEPMNSYERRILHSVLQSHSEVHTESHGVEPRRCVVIIPNEEKPGKNGKKFDRKPKNNARKKDWKEKKVVESAKPSRERTEEKPEINIESYYGNKRSFGYDKQKMPNIKPMQ